jgi:integrase
MREGAEKRNKNDAAALQNVRALGSNSGCAKAMVRAEPEALRRGELHGVVLVRTGRTGKTRFLYIIVSLLLVLLYARNRKRASEPSESAFALRWSDIDFERRQIHFTRATKYSKHIIVDFNPELESLLKELRDKRHPDTDAIFPGTQAEGSSSVGSLRKTFELVRDAAELPGFIFHSLRHYFISWCVMAGIDLLTIKEWAGHSDTLLISRVYGHLNARHRQEAAKKLAFPSRPQVEPVAKGAVDISSLSSAQLLELLQQKLKAESGQAK